MTAKDIDKAVDEIAPEAMPMTMREWAYQGGVRLAEEIYGAMGPLRTDEDLKKAVDRADRRRKDDISRANRMVTACIRGLNGETPKQDKKDEEEYMRRRKIVQAIWRNGVYDTLNAAAAKDKEEEYAEEEEIA